MVIRLGAQMDMHLNQRIYDAAFGTNLKPGNPLAVGQALNDLTNLRQFPTGNALFAFFDAALVPALPAGGLPAPVPGLARWPAPE